MKNRNNDKETKKVASGLSFYKIIYVLIFALLVIIPIICYFYTRQNVTKNSLEYYENVERAELEDGICEYKIKDLPTEDCDVTLAFYSTHQKSYIYDEYGNEICVLKGKRGIWGETTGSKWNFISIPRGTTNLTVMTVPVYKACSYQNIKFVVGEGTSIIKALVKNCVWPVIASFAIIILGVILIAYYLFYREEEWMNIALFHLGFFATIFGIWTLNETIFASLVIENRLFASNIAYLTLALMPIPITMFIKEFYTVRDKYVWKILVVAYAALYVVLFALQFAGVRDIRENLMYIQMSIGCTGIYTAVVIIYKIVKHKMTARVWTTVAGLAFVAVAMVVDITVFYHRVGDSDIFGRYSFLLFIVLLAIELRHSTNNAISKAKKIEQLEKFALTDAMTGVYNRNAFDMALGAIEDKENCSLVIFDLNNLKMCNDNYGHNVGDRYIKTCASIIDVVFNGLGDCYRFGGDEFVVIIKSQIRVDGIKKYRKKVDALIEEENIKRTFNFNISVASGQATFHPDADGNLLDTLKRADSDMYSNKKVMKEKLREE